MSGTRFLHVRVMVITLWLLVFGMSPVLLPAANAAGQSVTTESSPEAVMEAFRQKEIIEGKAVRITDREKQIIMFAMGITLLVLVLATASLGISMVMLGKRVFVAHMIFAGLSVTLAIAHAVVAVVWFFPF